MIHSFKDGFISRDDLFRNSILSHMMQSDSIESHLEENLGVDIDDNEAVHDLCCRVVGEL